MFYAVFNGIWPFPLQVSSQLSSLTPSSTNSQSDSGLFCSDSMKSSFLVSKADDFFPQGQQLDAVTDVGLLDGQAKFGNSTLDYGLRCVDFG